MSDLDNGGRQPNDGGDKTPEMDKDLDPSVIESIKDDETRKMLSSTIEQKKHHRTKRLEAEAEIARLKALLPAEKPPEPKPKAKAEDFDPEAYKAEVKEDVMLQVKYPDLDDMDVKRARALAKAEGKPLTEIIQDPFFQAFLNEKRSQQAAANAAAPPSSRNGQPGGRDFSRYEQDPTLIRTMSASEHKDFIAWQKAKARK